MVHIRKQDRVKLLEESRVSDLTAISIGVISAAIFLILLIFSRNYLLSFFGFLITALCFLEGSVEAGCIALFTEGFYGQLLHPEKAAMLAFIAL